ISFATIALPDLLNAKDGLSLTETQASWFGSISYLTQPFGALLSGPIVDYFGRKKANFLVNIPHLVAWVLMYFAWDLPTLFIANALLGLGTGVMEAPINSYVGEISEPSIRGALCTVTQLFTSIGVLLMYYLGTVVSWRTASLICLAAPLASMLLILFVPETPVWLLSQGRRNDALKALCYLRGWTTPEHVQNEYTQLVVYTKNLKRCVICKTDDLKILDCEHLKINRIQRFILRFRYVFLAKETLRPLTLVMLYFMFYVMSGLTPIRPNMVNVCRAFGMADDGKNIVLTVGIITFITSIVVIGIIKMAGKRKLILTAMLGTAISCTALSVYAKLNLDDSVFSYNSDTFPTNTSYIPLTLFYLLTVFTGLNIPWVLLGEVFPFRSRASAQGFAAAWNYVVTFLGSKTYIDLEKSVRLWGTFAVYAGFGFVGTIYLYFFMPETEGKHLHEIENYYSGKLRIFADDPFINFFKRFKRK
ncbi:facilitated trehalose transporter Tret1-like, partial [Manduca sexta]|uniref:facilitated trehalose transporter Tret1-like n=1 Tax=Manduca sexta TaxID=7130 RepID=UPI00188F2D89